MALGLLSAPIQACDASQGDQFCRDVWLAWAAAAPLKSHVVGQRCSGTSRVARPDAGYAPIATRQVGASDVRRLLHNGMA